MQNRIYYQGVYEAGIPSWQMNQVYVPQEKDQWCWSACIAMILDYYGIYVTQEILAQDICGIDRFGYPVNCPAYPFEISQSLGIKGTDSYGSFFTISAPLYIYRPDILELIEELINDRPIMVAYYNPDHKSSHAIVLTGCKYEVRGDTIYLTHIYARDPAKTYLNINNNGRRVISNVNAFLNSIHSYWYITVYKSQKEGTRYSFAG